MNFHKSLAAIRRTDAAVAEAVRPIIAHVLGQWHKHANKTPYMELRLAIDGGVDAYGLFGKKGETIRGVSRGLSMAFTGVKLGKQDPNANVDELTTAAVAVGIQTKQEARAANAAKRAARTPKEAPAAGVEGEPITCALIMPSGAATKLTPTEAAALWTTLEHLRALRTVDNIVDAKIAGEVLAIEG